MPSTRSLVVAAVCGITTGVMVRAWQDGSKPEHAAHKKYREHDGYVAERS